MASQILWSLLKHNPTLSNNYCHNEQEASEMPVVYHCKKGRVILTSIRLLQLQFCNWYMSLACFNTAATHDPSSNIHLLLHIQGEEFICYCMRRGGTQLIFMDWTYIVNNYSWLCYWVEFWDKNYCAALEIVTCHWILVQGYNLKPVR